MDNRLQTLIEKIKKLEQELSEEIQKKEDEYYYKIRGKKVQFEREARRKQRRFIKTIRRYLAEASLLNILTAPVIWACLLPALFMDLVVTMYQAICFPVYGVPKVKRGKFIVIDRHSLSYLNAIEKLNCVYCGYFNGLMAYVQEIAARTEQYWCPIKHARRVAHLHSRYGQFLEYGDAEGFRKRLDEIRKAYEDVE